MSEQRMKMLRRYRVRFQEIVASREDIGMKRARSDGQITMLLAELALLLPADEQELIQEMVRLHNALWEVSPAALAQLVRPRAGEGSVQALQEKYCLLALQSVDNLAKRSAYARIASMLQAYPADFPYVVLSIRGSLGEVKKEISSVVSVSSKQVLLERQAVYDEFLSQYGQSS